MASLVYYASLASFWKKSSCETTCKNHLYVNLVFNNKTINQHKLAHFFNIFGNFFSFQIAKLWKMLGENTYAQLRSVPSSRFNKSQKKTEWKSSSITSFFYTLVCLWDLVYWKFVNNFFVNLCYKTSPPKPNPNLLNLA